MKTPKEIELWFVIQALRREIARELSETHELSQKDIAKILGVTEAAVSQYRKDKRGKNVALSEDVVAKVKESTAKIVELHTAVFSETQKLSRYIRDSHNICDIHRMMDESVPEACEECRGHL